MIKYVTTAFIAAISITLTACSTNNANNTNPVQINDSLITDKGKLITVYTQAIAEFIKAAYKKQDVIFDTLYFGKRASGLVDDFPDIELPLTIENTHIRLISPQTGEKILQQQSKAVYVNMMGWVYGQNARFVLVVFSNGFKHQVDYTIFFRYSTTRKTYVLSQMQFEDYINSNGRVPERVTLYQEGKYINGK